MRIFRKKLFRSIGKICVKGSIALIAVVSMAGQAAGQVTPRAEGTNTEITLTETDNTTHIDITGGQRSSDGANLFHTFEQFDINADQSARFITAPDIQNVLSIITGGPSTIDGLLQVLGSRADLYLVNPAGILFGPNAQLNLPGSLSATTATGIGFDSGWLSVLGSSSQSVDYNSFVGHPTAFDFSDANSGAVVNLGDLTLGAGQSLTITGSTVVNTGSLRAPGGQITLTAVADGQLVRIGQGDQLLSLEVPPEIITQNNQLGQTQAFTPSTLGELLTGGITTPVNTLIENADGTVSLASTGTIIPEQGGTTVVSGELSVAGETGGEVNIFGSQVALFESMVSASGTKGGGTLRLGGDAQGTGIAPRARQTYVGSGVVLNVEATHDGDGGEIYIWSDEATNFYGSLSARGGYLGGNGGFADISGRRDLVYRGEVDLSAPQGENGTLLFDPSFIIIQNGNGTNIPAIPSLPEVLTTFANSGIPFILYEETLEAISPGTDIILEATVSIFLEDLADDVLLLQPGNNLRIHADVNDSGTGRFSMNSGDTIRAPGGTVHISAGYNLDESLVAGNIDTRANAGQGTDGNIVLAAQNLVQAGHLNAGNGTIEISSDSIDFVGGANSVTAESVTLQPDSTNSDIVIGNQGSAVNVLNISAGDIAALSESINLINIGRVDGTGSVIFRSDAADSTGNGFKSQTHILGSNLAIGGPDLDTVWNIDFSSSGSPVNTLSNYGNVLIGTINEITGGNGNDTINFRDRRASISDLIDGGAGDLTLLGDDLYIPVDIKGEGNLFISTISPSAEIELGGTVDPGEPNTLNLLDGELSRILGAAFTSITIGDENGGPITLRSDLSANIPLTLRSGDRIDTTAGTLSTTGRSPLTLSAAEDIQAGQLSAEGGDISLVSMGGDVIATSIDARGIGSMGGEGGDIDIAANRYVQITGWIDSTSGPSIETNEGNSIAISHGGNSVVPFTVGTSSTNGTVGSISNQTDTIDNDSFLGSYSIGELSISTIDVEIPEIGVEVPEIGVEVPELALPTGLRQALAALSHLNSESGGDGSSLSILSPNLEEKTSQEIFSRIESAASEQFNQFLSIEGRETVTRVATLQQVQETLAEAQKNLSIKPALLYVYFVPDAAIADDEKETEDNLEAFLYEGNPTDQLEVMLISDTGVPIRRRQWGVTRAQVEAVAKTLRHEATSQFSRPGDYLPPAQQLYRWIIQPLEDELEQLQVDNLAFILDDGLRTIPLAVLHDGDNFLVEHYSIGLMPTFSLTDLVATVDEPPFTRRESEVLAMGASRFSAQPPLPAVEAELSLISQDIWQGEAFLNEQFTLNNLKSELGRDRYDILHLATHAVFNAGDWDNSYIQLWNERVTLNELHELNLESSDIGLIILSACNTALGDRASEYGFAGFAVNAGSESALASLWPVSDEGTLGFMTQFYQQLSGGRLRAESLRKAQISLLQGDIRIVNGEIKGPNGEVLAEIPELAESGNWDFSHPFYWSAFTMIGNPW